jgi:hypothetical protein
LATRALGVVARRGQGERGRPGALRGDRRELEQRGDRRVLERSTDTRLVASEWEPKAALKLAMDNGMQTMFSDLMQYR